MVMTQGKHTGFGLALVFTALALIGAGLGIFGLLSLKEEDVTERQALYQPRSFADLPGWTKWQPNAADLAALRQAFAQSCAVWLRRQDATRPISDRISPELQTLAGNLAQWRRICAEIEATEDAALIALIEARFTPFQVSVTEDREITETGLFTGYYVPELSGSRVPSAQHPIPLHRRPEELVMVDLGLFREGYRGDRIAGYVAQGQLRPYATRAQIDTGALDGRGLELVWLDDPIAAFFLHIQGSGRINLDDGSAMMVGYAAQNGHPYFAIGRALIEEGHVPREQMSMQAIENWLRAHPNRFYDYLHKNPSYIFFRDLGEGEALGSLGTPLTPHVSLAVDQHEIPLGAPLWVDIAADEETGLPALQRLMLAQDTGGAIRGAVRGDIFWGYGAEAADMAGRMRSVGRYWLLLPKAE